MSEELKKIFRKLNNNETIKDASKKLGLDEISIYGIIYQKNQKKNLYPNNIF